MPSKKDVEQREARRLRTEEGMSVKKIAKKLQVSSGSVSLWVRNVELTSEQKVKLQSNSNSINRREQAIASQKKFSELRKQYQEVGKNKALEANDKFLFGCALYWA